jgi:Family of unknown function (DUF6526)
MSEQNFKTHGRYIFLWHIVTGSAVIAVIIGSIINLISSSKDNLFSASLLVVISLILSSIFWYSRAFALRAQDRAIRAEENFRHFILTGKPFNNNLRMRQIIALRFASDEELPVLAKRSVNENLTQRQIKESIKNWQADHNRA